MRISKFVIRWKICGEKFHGFACQVTEKLFKRLKNCGSHVHKFRVTISIDNAYLCRDGLYTN